MGNATKKGAALVFLSIAFGLGAQARELVFAVGEWAPYTSAALPGQGAASEIVSAACAAAGLRAVIEFVPWNRAEAEVLKGRAFATFPYLRMPERDLIYFFSEPLFSSEIAILAHGFSQRTRSFLYDGDPASFRGFVVGTTAGSKAVSAPLEAAGVRVEETAELFLSIRKLAAGRIDFVVDERNAIVHSLRTLVPGESARFRFIERNFSGRMDYRLLVSKEYPDTLELLERFDQGIETIRSNGTLQVIYDRRGIGR